MTDGQFTALIGALLAIAGTIATAIKWAIGRVTKSIDSTHDYVHSNTKAMIANTASNAILSTKIDTIADFVQRHTPAEGVKKRARTAPHGLEIVTDEDE